LDDYTAPTQGCVSFTFVWYGDYLKFLDEYLGKHRRIRLAGLVARMRAIRNAHTVLGGEPEEKIPLEKLGMDGRIILKRGIRNNLWGFWLDLSCLD
jgi:hypothetical protein